MDPQKISDLVNQDILTSMGLGDLPQEEKDKLINGMIHDVQARIIDRCMQKLSDEEKLELDGMLQEPVKNKDAILAFFREKIPTFDDIVLDEVVEFKHEMIEDAKILRDKAGEIAGESKKGKK